MNERAAVYCRVSTAEQAQHGTSLDDQQDRCESAVEEHDWVLVGTYIDRGVSGSLASRPELDHMMSLVEAGELDVVIITKLDRIARSLTNLLDLFATFAAHDVTLIALDDPTLDMSTASGRMMVHIRGAFAEMERSLIRERIIAGRQRRADAGGWLGGPPPFGYRAMTNPNGNGMVLVVDETEAAVIRTAYRMLVEEGATTGEVARHLNQSGMKPRRSAQWGHHHVRRQLLDARGISGRWPFRRARGPEDDPHAEVIVDIPAIITPEQHALLNSALERTTTAHISHGEYLLSGRVTSPHGARMQGVPGNGGNRYYRCPDTGSTRPPDHAKCDCRRMHAQTVERVVWTEVARLLGTPGVLSALADEVAAVHAPTATVERRRLADLDEEIGRLTALTGTQASGLIAAGIDPDAVAVAVKPTNDALAAAKARRVGLIRTRSRNLHASGLADRLKEASRNIDAAIETADVALRRRILDLLDVQVAVDGWETCDTCSGKGLIPNPDGQQRRGRKKPDEPKMFALVCPTCLRSRFVPVIRITGSIPAALAAALTEDDDSDVDESIPFSVEAKVA